MKLNTIGSNQTELTLKDGTIVFFSYQTPVAARTPTGKYMKTATQWSNTTCKHIAGWLRRWQATNVETVPQESLNNLAGEV